MLKYLLEIRNKFILFIATFFSTLLVCYKYKEVLLFLITQMHLNDKNLYFIFTHVTELFYIYFKVVVFFSVQITSWYSLYHTLFFVSTALYFREFKFLCFLFYSGTFFWLFSCLLSSYIIVPLGWTFFLSFQLQQDLHFEARISEYFNFYTEAYFLCFIYCQLFPIMFFFLSDIEQNYVFVKKYRKVYFYLFLVFSTLITPPDLVSQIITAFLIVVIYESILFFSIFNFVFKQLLR